MRLVNVITFGIITASISNGACFCVTICDQLLDKSSEKVISPIFINMLEKQNQVPKKV